MEEELVLIKKDEAVCTSLDVAEKFNKRHDVVLRNIEAFINENETTKLWFLKSNYQVKGNKKRYPMYYMTRDGFSLLVMGFTGKKAFE